jgi:hypothetical protein
VVSQSDAKQAKRSGKASRYRRKTSKMRAFILGRSEYLPWLWHGIFAFTLTAGIRFLLQLLGQRFDQQPAAEGALDATILFFSFLIVNFITTQSLGGLFQVITHVMAVAQRQPSPLLMDAVVDYFEDAQRVVDGLTGDGYIVKSNVDMEKWYRSFFDLGGNQYIGIDVFPPTTWMSRYAFYLRVHEDSIRGRKANGQYPDPDCRVILATSDAMHHDRSSNEEAYEQFSGWHWNPDRLVELYWADPHELPPNILDLRRSLPTGAVALWQDFAVLFEEVEVDQQPATKLQARFPGRPGAPTYEQVRAYVQELRDFARAKPFRGGDVGLDLVELPVAQKWNEYVGFHERLTGRDNPLGKFLLDRIGEQFPHRDCFILDAAAGVGCDAITLIRKGFRVDINEADPRYAAMIRQNADDPAAGLVRRSGLPPSSRLPLYGSTWQDLRGGLPEGSMYDVVLVLGNSICLVEPKDRSRCLREFVSILWPNTGTLIIDERNWADMIENAEKYTANPLLFPSATGSDPLYRGTSVRGYPTEIHEGLIRWRIFNAEPPVHDPDDLRTRWIGTKAFLLYPFRHGELYKNLCARFKSVQIYADLELVPEEPFLNQTLDRQPLFYTYVAGELKGVSLNSPNVVALTPPPGMRSIA